MKLIHLFFICTTFFLWQSAQGEVCQEQVTHSQYQQTVKTFDDLSSGIQGYLSGSELNPPQLEAVFGPEFQLSETKERIEKLQLILQEVPVLPVEYKSLYHCLLLQENSNHSEIFLGKLRKVSALKIEFLRKNQLLGDSLRENRVTSNELPELKKEIAREKNEALGKKSELESDLFAHQGKINREQDAKRRELLSYKNTLTKLKIELLDQGIKINKNLEDKILYFQNLSDQLSSLSSQLESSQDKVLLENFEKVEELWLSLSKENYFDLFKGRDGLSLPTIPKELDRTRYRDDVDEILSSRKELLELRKKILLEYTDKKSKEHKLLNQLLVSCNSLRAGYFEKVGSIDAFQNLMSRKSYHVLNNEILSTPYRFISFGYVKYLYVREKLNLGREGYLSLFLDLFKIIFLVVGIFFFRWLFESATQQMDRFLHQVLHRNRSRFLLKRIFSLWSKVKGNFVSILWILALHLLESFGPSSEYQLMYSLIRIYFYGELIKSLVTSFLGEVSRLDSGNFMAFKLKAEKTSSRFRLIFLVYQYLMIFIEITIGKVFLYAFFNLIIGLNLIYLLLKESAKWEEEFSRYMEKRFSGIVVEFCFNLLKKLPLSFRSVFLLVLICSLSFFDFVFSYTEGFEFTKKISANLFKKQIESVEADEDASTKIPQEYRDHFNMSSIGDLDDYVMSEKGIEKNIISEIVEWKEDKSDEHSLVIYGDKGVGKTSLIKKIVSDLENYHKLKTIYAKMPSKVLSKDDLWSFLSELICPGSEENFSNIYACDEYLDGPTIIFLDEAQNVFLSKIGGFEAYYELINIVNLNTEKIFWVLSFNKYSWLFLDRAFGRGHFFRNIFEVPGWSDTKIKELVLKRHRKEKFRLSYDLLINATKSQEEIDRYASIESKFFKLLWELSRGNPRAALHLWLSALSRHGRNTLNVNIPKEVEVASLEQMNDQILFVIGHVLKHENLLSSEIAETSNLPMGIVRNAVRIGLEKRFFYRDERHRYMVDISTQYGIIRSLRQKNLIYGK